MSHTTWLTQSIDPPQAPSPVQTTLPPTLSGSLLVLLAGVMGWQMMRQRWGPETTRSSQTAAAARAMPQALHWMTHAKTLERSKHYEAAIAVYDEALQYYPQDYRLWHERGLILAKLQRFTAAIASYDRAFALRPQQRDLAHERGDALLELERYQEAIDSFDIFLRYDPHSGHIWTDRGYALYQLGHYEAALQSFAHVIKTGERDRSALLRAYSYQIAALQKLGQLEAALQSCHKAIKLYPDQESLQIQERELRHALDNV